MKPHPVSGLRGSAGRVRSFDGVRAIAISMVVLFHAGYLPGGWLGVDVFFGISGFLITRVIFTLWSDGIASPASRFYIRRAVRLIPASTFLLVVYTGVALVTDPGVRHERLISVSAAATYTYDILASHRRMVGLGHMWSLSMEEQFYIFWPLFLASCIRWRRMWVAVVGSSVGIAAALSRSALLIQHGAPRGRVSFGPDTRIAGLLAGCLVALLAQKLGKRSRPGASWFVVLPSLLIVYLAVNLSSLDTRSYYFWPVVAATLAAVCLVLLEADESSLPARALAVAPLVFLGDISYGLYLWHLPVLEALLRKEGHPSWPLVIFAVLLSVAIATASRFLLEKPLLRRVRTSPARRGEQQPHLEDSAAFRGGASGESPPNGPAHD